MVVKKSLESDYPGQEDPDFCARLKMKRNRTQSGQMGFLRSRLELALQSQQQARTDQ